MRATDDGVEIDVWVLPNGTRSEIAGLQGDALRVRVAIPEEGGRANESVCRLLADVTGASVEPVRGHPSRHKVVRVGGVDVADLRRQLGV